MRICAVCRARENRVIVDRCFGSLVFEVFGNDDHLNAYCENVEPGHHEGLLFVSRNQSFLVDRGRNVVAGLKHGQGVASRVVPSE